MSFPAAFDAFVAPARRRPAIWRILVSLVLIAAVSAGWFAAMYGMLVWALGGEAASRTLIGMVAPVTPVSTLLLLGTFIGLAIAPALAVMVLHKRGVGSLFGPGRRLVRHFGAGAAAVAILYTLSMLVWSSGFDARPNLAPGLWTMLLPLSLLLILIQTGAEEMIFRGYLQQQLAARFPVRAVFLVLPALVFGALHFDPTLGLGSALLIAASATVFGLIAADLTYVTGSLGAAWGLHFANNVLAILGVATQGTITGLALYVTPYGAEEIADRPWLVGLDLIGLLAIWFVLRRWLSKS